MEQNKKYCKALKKGTAFEELYKGWLDRTLCEENPCPYGYKNRFVETRCMDGEKRFVCPSKGLIEKKGILTLFRNYSIPKKQPIFS